MSKRVGLLLSGCGAWDGSDIHETVFTLLALDRAGAKVICTAPDIEQHHVLNHMTQEEMAAKRNVLMESARIARGQIIDLASVDAHQLDALIMPGGFGTVKNLSPFALKGPTKEVNPQVRNLLETLLTLKKPMGAIALAAIPLVIALANHQPAVAVSDDTGIATAIEAIGGRHHHCKPGEIYVDKNHKIVTTPAAKAEEGIAKIAARVERMVGKVLDLIG